MSPPSESWRCTANRFPSGARSIPAYGPGTPTSATFCPFRSIQTRVWSSTPLGVDAAGADAVDVFAGEATIEAGLVRYASTAVLEAENEASLDMLALALGPTA